MGFLDMIGLGVKTRSLLGTGQDGIKSPWAPEGSLRSVVWSDILGVDAMMNLPMVREEAIAIPAVSKGRNLLFATIAKWPLVALRYDATTKEDTDVTSDHKWLYRTNGTIPPYSRMGWTIDDGVFYGSSLWLTTRGGAADDDGRKPILDAEWCPWEWWDINQDGRFVLYESGDRTQARILNRDEYLFFDFPSEGLLNLATRTMRGAQALEEAWVGRARNPIPLVDLHRTEDAELDDDEVDDMVADWAKARTSPNGAIGSTPAGVELNVHGSLSVDLMIEGRNGVRTDIGSYLNVRASVLDGTIGVDSLTYTTNEGERNAFFEMDVPFWTDYVEARLSQDDVVPRGSRVRFVKYQSNPENTGPKAED
jgi:hypothetical protein